MAKESRSYLAIIAIIPLVLSTDAFAQAGGSQEISVIAPQVTVHEEKKRDAGFQRVMVYSVERRVSFADLDLKSVAGVDKFKQRIKDAAKAGCDQITKQHPQVRDNTCLKTSVDDAMVRANQVIEAANR